MTWSNSGGSVVEVGVTMGLLQRLEIRQGQSLVMTPQLLQAIKLLQLSHLELQSFVEGELVDGAPAAGFVPSGATDDRSLFVIRPDGRVAYVTRPFKVLTPSAYTELGAVVDSLAPADDS